MKVDPNHDLIFLLPLYNWLVTSLQYNNIEWSVYISFKVKKKWSGECVCKRGGGGGEKGLSLVCECCLNDLCKISFQPA